MLRIAFFDNIPAGYTPDTPYQRPLGGSQSATCYLAEALARLGHSVTLATNIAAPGVVRGVHCPGGALTAEFLKSLDAVIVVSNAAGDLPTRFRPACAPHTRFVLWQHHAHNQPYVACLADPAVRGAWDGFALLSDWQARRFRQHFGLVQDRIGIMRNGLTPAFANLFGDGPILAHKPWPPVLAYTSTPFRGLDRLIEAFPLVRAAIPGTRLKVFSSMKVYDITRMPEDPDGDEGFRDLYARCRATEGVEYVGSLSQPELARQMREVTCLAYPNTFAETSCIAALEAMAAGCQVVTSAQAALPETTAGYAWLLPVDPVDAHRHAQGFAQGLIEALLSLRADPGAERFLRAQVNWVNATAPWEQRAREWTVWLSWLLGRPSVPSVSAAGSR